MRTQATFTSTSAAWASRVVLFARLLAAPPCERRRCRPACSAVCTAPRCAYCAPCIALHQLAGRPRGLRGQGVRRAHVRILLSVLFSRNASAVAMMSRRSRPLGRLVLLDAMSAHGMFAKCLLFVLAIVSAHTRQPGRTYSGGRWCGAVRHVAGRTFHTPTLAVGLLRVRRCLRACIGFTSDLQCAVGVSGVGPKAGIRRGLLAAVPTFAGLGVKGCRGVSTPFAARNPFGSSLYAYPFYLYLRFYKSVLGEFSR